MKKWTGRFLMTFALTIILTGCGGKDSSNDSGDNGPDDKGQQSQKEDVLYVITGITKNELLKIVVDEKGNIKSRDTLLSEDDLGGDHMFSLLDIEGDLLCLADSIADRVYVIDTTTYQVATTIETPQYSNPFDCEILEGYGVATTLYMNDSVLLWNSQSDTTKEIKLKDGARPEGLDDDGTMLYVAATFSVYNPDTQLMEYSDPGIYVVDLATESLLDIDQDSSNGDTPIFTTGLNTQYIALSSKGLFSVSTGDYFQTLSVMDLVDPDTFQIIKSLDTNGTYGRISAGNSLILLSSSVSQSVLVFGVEDLTSKGSINIEGGGDYDYIPAAVLGNNWIYVASSSDNRIHLIDPGSLTVTEKAISIEGGSIMDVVTE